MGSPNSWNWSYTSANLLPNSQDFDNAMYWTLHVAPNGTKERLEAADVPAPDDTWTAFKMIDDNVYDAPGKNDHFVEVRIPPMLVHNNFYTASVYLKPAGDTWGMVDIYGSEYKTWKNSFFDITNGAVGYKTTPAIDSTRISSAGNGWYRCEVTFNSGYGNVTPVMQIFSSRGDAYDYPNIDFTGDNLTGIYIWGAQLEKGTAATPYIKTTTKAPIKTYFSTSQNPVYTFTSAGNYSVSMTATNADGSDSSLGWVNASKGTTASLPVLAVSASPASVLVRTPTPVNFTVKNQSSGRVINGATVTLTGAAMGSGVTGADGNATISVNAGTAGTITATAAMTRYTNGVTTVTATSLPGTSSITVKSPNGGEAWKQGTSHAITWSYTGNPGSSVKIELLKNGMFYQLLKSNTSIGSSGSGSYAWTISANTKPGSDYRIRINSTGNSAYSDTSHANFAIGGSQNPIVKFSTNVTSGNVPLSIKFTDISTGTSVNKWNWSFGDGTWFNTTTASLRNATHTYSAAGTYTAKLTVCNASGCNTTVPGTTITVGTTTSSITVSSPNGGETWKQNSSHTITWSYTGNPGSFVKIELLKNDMFYQLVKSNTSIGNAGSGSYAWTISANTKLGTDYRIRVNSTGNSAFSDMSNANFTIN